MTQEEEKELLLKDLCAKWPYKVKGIITYDKSDTIFTVEGIDNNVLHLSDAEECYVEDFKPYLRPISSMTYEEKHYIRHHFCPEYYFDVDLQGNISDNDGSYIYEIELSKIVGYIDYLNAHHFDYHGLIEKGLAIEVTEDNNPYKE